MPRIYILVAIMRTLKGERNFECSDDNHMGLTPKIGRSGLTRLDRPVLPVRLP
jgi:hypothetical protein